MENQPDRLASKVLEDSITDIHVRYITSQVNEYNELIDRINVPNEEIESVIDDLNEQWRNFIGISASATGQMTFIDLDDYEQKNESNYVKKGHEDLKITLGGFIIDYSPRKVDVAGEIVELKQRKILLNVFKDTSNHEDYKDEEGLFEGHADINEISLEFDNITTEQGLAHFAYFYPDTAASILRIIEEHEDREDDITVALARLKLPQIDDEPSLMAFQVYLTKLMDYDTTLPYNCAILGDMYVINGIEDIRPLSVDGACVMYPQFITFKQIDSASPFELYLHANIPQEDKNTPDAVALIPLKSIRSLSSFRRTIFDPSVNL